MRSGVLQKLPVTFGLLNSHVRGEQRQRNAFSQALAQPVRNVWADEIKRERS